MTPCSLVIETNNLRGGDADLEQTAASLERLLRHLRRQTVPLSALDEVVITHDGLSPAIEARLEEAAGRDLRYVLLPEGADYYQAKNLGFAATRSGVVVFADSDCWPETTWLEQLIAPFHDPETEVVAGRTTYRGDALGIAATSIDFMYFQGPLGEGCTRNFYANNVAFRRSRFDSDPFPIQPEIYRGSCQLLGLALQARGVPIRFVPGARTVHRFPDTVQELVALRLHRGRDARLMTPIFAEHLLPRGWRWLGRGGRLSAAALMAGRLLCSLRALGRQDMPEVHGLARLETVATLVLLSGLDAAAAVGVERLGSAGSSAALSYHSDADRLAAGV